MMIHFGKHKGKTTEEVVLKEPKYVAWILDQTVMNGPMAKIRPEIKRLVAHFDAKPIQERCFRCARPATRYTGGRMASSAKYWCESCDPESAGGDLAKFTVVRTYQDAVLHAAKCGGSEADYKTVIRRFAISKGLPERSGQAQMEVFFAQSEPDADSCDPDQRSCCEPTNVPAKSINGSRNDAGGMIARAKAD